MYAEAIGVQCTDIYNILKCVKKPTWIGKGWIDGHVIKHSKMSTVESRQWVYSSFNLSESFKICIKMLVGGRMLK